MTRGENALLTHNTAYFRKLSSQKGTSKKVSYSPAKEKTAPSSSDDEVRKAVILPPKLSSPAILLPLNFNF